jgi:hypothetical protein
MVELTDEMLSSMIIMASTAAAAGDTHGCATAQLVEAVGPPEVAV